MSKWFCSIFWYCGNAWKTENEIYSQSNNSWCRYGLSISFKTSVYSNGRQYGKEGFFFIDYRKSSHQNTYKMYKTITDIMKFSFLKQMKFATKNTIQINYQHSDNQLSIIILQSYTCLYFHRSVSIKLPINFCSIFTSMNWITFSWKLNLVEHFTFPFEDNNDNNDDKNNNNNVNNDNDSNTTTTTNDNNDNDNNNDNNELLIIYACINYWTCVPIVAGDDVDFTVSYTSINERLLTAKSSLATVILMNLRTK